MMNLLSEQNRSFREYLKQYQWAWRMWILYRNARYLHYKIPQMIAAYRRSRWERRLLWHLRQSYEDAYRNETPTPLVTVKTLTHNRSALLKRAVQSVLEQTYQNFEILVIGDDCTDDTAQCLEDFHDPRIRFYNVPRQGELPQNSIHRWMVVGTHAANRAVEDAHGQWILNLDDDDLYEPDHIETLIRFAQEYQYELVYSKMARQINTDTWANMGREGSFGQLFRRSDDGPYIGVGHSSVMYRRYLRLFKGEIDVWRLNIPGDQYLWLRMRYAKVRAGFIDRVTVKSPLRPNTTQEGFRAEDRA